MSKKLVIIGASGHGKVIADIAKKNGYYEIVFLDDNETIHECGGELEDNKNLTLRNSIVGPDINENGIGLLNWFMKQDGEVNGYGFFESTIMWVYQNIIGRLVIESVKMADLVIVQTDWMKEAVADKARINKSKIVVDFPSDIIPDGYRYKEAKNCFFYPANSTPFKNHRLILEAAKILNAQGIYNFEVIFTLSGNETEDIKSIAQTAMKEKINFRWIGAISREKVFELYEKSVLLFPSYIETVGLPVYEAKSLGCPILVSDCAYARNIVNNYNKAEFFSWNDEKALAELMKKYIK